MGTPAGRLRLGTSGYQYDHWKGVFYPDNIRKREWFAYYQRHFDTVEINNTFYNLPRPETFDHWRQAAGPDFCFVLKYSRYGSHIKRLKEPEQHLPHFVERSGRLEDRLGPILVQLPPGWRPVPERLDAFLQAAPAEWRWALEFRDPRWLNQEIFSVLRRHRAALCLHDLITDHPAEVTTDWVYLRFHGGNGGNYSAQKLSAAAARIVDYLGQGWDTYVFFNNDARGYAVMNARDLRRYIDNRRKD